MKTKSRYGFLVMILVVVALFVLVVFKYVFFPIDTSYPSQSQLTQNQQTRPTISESPARSSIIDNFLILVSAEVERSTERYTIKENFVPKIAGENEKNSFLQSSKDPKNKDSLYKIEVIKNDVEQEIYNTTITYCPPNTDVCTPFTDREIPINSHGFLEGVFIPLNTKIKVINFYINNILIKSIPKKDSTLKITNLTKKPKRKIYYPFTIVDGYEISWSIENSSNSSIWLSLEYLASPTKWQYVIFGDSNDYKSYFVDPKTIQSTLDAIDFRLIVTDGFNTDIWVERSLITSSKDRNIELFLHGIDDREFFVIGQGVNLELSFFDPETGAGCGAKGCTEGENKDKYEVVWTSDKQTICSDQIFDRGTYYIFKKEGWQTIKVKVQHKEKPYLEGEKTVRVNVRSDGSYYQDKDPNCSAI